MQIEKFIKYFSIFAELFKIYPQWQMKQKQ